MALSAHILRSNFSVDLARPVSLETLEALGRKTASLSGSQDLEQSAQKLAQEWGLSLTHEDSVVPLDLKQGTSNPSKKLSEFPLIITSTCRTFAATDDAAILLKSGNIYFDVEDVISKNRIRVEFGPRHIYHIPAGAKLRFTFSDQTTNMAGLAFIKDGLTNVGVFEEKDLDNHTSREAYLRNIEKFERMIVH
ncbi:hypothetical protein GYMLUDRAFT_242374 [Collybiopsis luxurians FD-317 M1]|uniref:Uncharacterized protein n=1 Tax=Collybiopsis luxurians FD-317 M1 TaxID=944289 RepID=A0A0D0CJ16_9AGAR|nr:hypothetical protein GYMLUDRAFT_242374 [Collybiopsis luxurians FD-317 M1]